MWHNRSLTGVKYIRRGYLEDARQGGDMKQPGLMVVCGGRELKNIFAVKRPLFLRNKGPGHTTGSPSWAPVPEIEVPQPLAAKTSVDFG